MGCRRTGGIAPGPIVAIGCIIGIGAGVAPALSALGVPVGNGERDRRIGAAVFADGGATGLGVGVAVGAGIAVAGRTTGGVGVALARGAGARLG